MPLDDGLTVHLIEGSEAVGPGRELAGSLLVEKPDGTFRRMTGRELVDFVERNPWVRDWRTASEQ